MSEFEVPTEYKLTTLQQRLEALNVEGWHNEEAKLVAISIGNTDEVERLTANIEIIKTAIADVKARIADLSA
jgi:N-methylhydantoinase B/oxoprolinase/acetone carboxylase alpha subunit